MIGRFSGPLVVSYLLNLPDHYSLKAIVKTINIALLQAKFLLILNSQNFNQSDDIVHVDDTKIRPCSMYEYYAHRGSAFDRISIYKYLQFVSIVNNLNSKGVITNLQMVIGRKKILFKNH